MNNLENLASQQNEEEEYALYRRAEEIRKQYNKNILLALESIQSAQEKQREVQNKRENSKITVQPILPGTKFFIKAVGLQNKHEPKLYGPYIIKGQTPNGNYWLKNRKNKNSKIKIKFN
ncbi:unnamed protein product [Brachionus calyciflorus]|uniref:Uncharacterized protein n=1 Tax=Brachionus calyciflorus TaxID=104777 RepID=A0A813V4Q4_9BILA|nr:unnamed protein product [Brachionus calyciflorus]